MSGPESSFEPVGPGRFPPTHWSMVMNAGKDSSPDARRAFGALYERYLPPLLAFLRFRGMSDDLANECAQDFFRFLLERGSLGMVNRKGKFRSWLLTCLKNFLSDRYDKQHAYKRGGGREHVPIGGAGEENAVEPAHTGRTPEEEYERQYALAFVRQVMERLEREYSGERQELFAELHPFLQEKKAGISHAELARKLDMTSDAVTKAISRMRQRFRQLFDHELEQLVGSRSELDEEKRFLLAALGR